MKQRIFSAGFLLSARGESRQRRVAGPPVSEPVEVLYDRAGIPHIFARNEADLFAVQGYLHARDRLWQMESARRVVAGRIAEAAGPALADLDHFSLVAGFAGLRDRAVAATTPENRRTLSSYAAGINAYIEHSGGYLPLEIKNLGITPGTWTVEDLCAVLPLNSWFLQTNYLEEVVALLARKRLDSDTFAEMYPSHPGASLPRETFFDAYRNANIGPLLPAALGFYAELAAAGLAGPATGNDGGRGNAPAAERAPGTPASAGGGSNAWVVGDGEHGRPVLANDPHLGISVPQIWHLCHLHCPTVNVAGVSMPGVPGVVIGRTETLAWGFTNVMTDVVDLFMVRVDPREPHRYRVGNEWRDIETETHEIPIRGQAPRKVTIHRTVHGPLISELTPGVDAAVALKWYGTLPADGYEDTTLNGFFAFFRAHSVDDALEAGRLVKTVGQNLMCADSDGNIAWHPTGLVPVRRRHSGRCPADGSGSADGPEGPDDWIGFMSYDELPSSRNPARGYIVTANNRPVGVDTADAITHSWCADYRHDRISARIEALAPGKTLEAMQDIQSDVHVLQADRLLPILLGFDYSSPDAAAAAKVLAAWDRVANTRSVGTSLFSIFLVEFERILLGGLLEDATPAYLSIAPLFYTVVDHALRGGDIRHLLERSEFAARGLAGLCEDALARSWRIAVEVFGGRPSRWAWGRLHTYRFAHMGATGAVTRWLLDRGPFAAPGVSTTVNVAAQNPANVSLLDEKRRAKPTARRRAEYQVVTIPSMRFTASLADPDRTFIMAPMGQSGRPGNRHYDDLIRSWIKTRVVPLPLSREGAERVCRKRTTFVPAEPQG